MSGGRVRGGSSTGGASGGGSSTLAQIVAARQGGPEALGRLRARIRHDRTMSAGYLWLGFTVLGSLLVVRGLASLAWSWTDGPWRWLSVLAWAFILLAFAAAVITARTSGGVIPSRVSLLVVVSGVVAVAADLVAFLGRGGAPLYPTAIIGFGACLFICLPLQPIRRSAAGAIVLALSGGVSVAAGWLVDPASLPAGVTGLLLGLAPVLGGLSMIQASDSYLARRIEQAVTESLVTAPAVGHGLGAASELRRLDGDAEDLLDTVSRLPPGRRIDRATAARAALLSDELRLALMADHQQSWLQIAVAESEHLGGTVRIVDPAVLAAHLSPEQRRDLLAIVWLCVAEAPLTAPALDLTFLQSRTGAEGPAALPTIVFSIDGTNRRGIDAAVWPLFTRLGRHTVDLSAGRALVVVELG